MGWWGCDIMEGDTPLDCRGDLVDYLLGDERVAELESLDDDGMDTYEQIHNEAYDALKCPVNSTTAMLSIKDGVLCGYNPDIALQVLGEMIMVSGHPFPKQVREACIAAAQKEIDTSEKGWRTEGVRQKCLTAYIGRVRAYKNGEAVEPSSKGLFVTMTEGMAEGD